MRPSTCPARPQDECQVGQARGELDGGLLEGESPVGRSPQGVTLRHGLAHPAPTPVPACPGPVQWHPLKAAIARGLLLPPPCASAGTRSAGPRIKSVYWQYSIASARWAIASATCCPWALSCWSVAAAALSVASLRCWRSASRAPNAALVIVLVSGASLLPPDTITILRVICTATNLL